MPKRTARRRLFPPRYLTRSTAKANNFETGLSSIIRNNSPSIRTCRTDDFSCPDMLTPKQNNFEFLPPSIIRNNSPSIRTCRTDAFSCPDMLLPKQNNFEALPPSFGKATSSYRQVFTFGSANNFESDNSSVRITTRLPVSSPHNLFRLANKEADNIISRLQTFRHNIELDEPLFSWNFFASSNRHAYKNSSDFGSNDQNRFGVPNTNSLGNCDGFRSSDFSDFGSRNFNFYGSNKFRDFGSSNFNFYGSSKFSDFGSSNFSRFGSDNPNGFPSSNSNRSGCGTGRPSAYGTRNSYGVRNTSGYEAKNPSNSNRKSPRGSCKQNTSDLLKLDSRVNRTVPTRVSATDDEVVYLYTVDSSAAGRIVDEIDLDITQKVPSSRASNTLPPRKVLGEIQNSDTMKSRSSGKRKRKDSLTDDRGKRKNLGQSQCALCETPYNDLLQKDKFLAISRCGHLYCSVCKNQLKNCNVCGTALKDLRKIFV